MKINLTDICDIQSGAPNKSSVLNSDGTVIYLNLKDFKEGELSLDGISYIEGKVNPKYFITPDDVLLSTRIKFNAYVVPELSGKKFVASTNFVILKLDKNKVLRDYLLWYLNHPLTTRKLMILNPSPSKMLFLSLSKLKELEIDLPSIDKQKEIIHLQSLYQKEKEITQRLSILKEKYIQTILLNLAKS